MKNREIAEFESRFEEAETEIYALTGSYGMTASKAGKDKLWTVGSTIIGIVDAATGEIKEGKGRLEWYAQENRRGKWIYNLKKETIYHLKVRKIKKESLSATAPAWMENIFFVVKVLKKNAKHPALETILAEFQKPVVMEDTELGNYKLDKDLGIFEGSVNWLGENCHVRLKADEEDETSPGKVLELWRDFYHKLSEWDEKCRKFAAEELTETANEWLESEEDDEETKEITREEFAKRITVSEISFRAEGDFEVYYDDDEMFWGHVIIVSGNIHDGLEDADIAG